MADEQKWKSVKKTKNVKQVKKDHFLLSFCESNFRWAIVALMYPSRLSSPNTEADAFVTICTHLSMLWPWKWKVGTDIGVSVYSRSIILEKSHVNGGSCTSLDQLIIFCKQVASVLIDGTNLALGFKLPLFSSSQISRIFVMANFLSSADSLQSIGCKTCSEWAFHVVDFI